MMPIAQYDNYLMVSTLLWLDNLILTKLRAFENTNVQFYPVYNKYYGYKTYASPFGQLVADSSISGATIGTGIYINNIFYGSGQNVYKNIDYGNGRIYSTGNLSSPISGEFSIKYFNIKLTDEPEEKILTDTNYQLRPRTNTLITGLQENQINYPIIYVKDNGSFNKPFAFGGLDNTINNLRFIILTDNQFSLNAVNSLIRDSCRKSIPILNSDQIPFNLMGDYKTGSYNYKSLTDPILYQNEVAHINEIYVTKYNDSYIEMRNLNTKIYWSIIDLEVQKQRYPRI